MFRIRETFKGFSQVIKQCQRYYFDSFVPHGFFRELVEKNRRHNGLYAVRFLCCAFVRLARVFGKTRCWTKNRVTARNERISVLLAWCITPTFRI